MEFSHYSVLLNETIDGLNIKPDGIYADGTLGGGGHSEQILKRLTGSNGHHYGFDQDRDAIAAASKRLEIFGDKFTAIKDNYENMTERLAELGVRGVDGIVLDLGVSSYQLDESDRGFSYRYDDAPLDMRMDRDQELTAADILATYSEEKLTQIFFDYGEERFSRQIAKKIVAKRVDEPIVNAGQLNDIIRSCIPAKLRQDGHPSKRVYQALRIELNRELTVLSESIEAMVDCLNDGGRLCIITFHSLEDRIVKNAFKTMESPCTCPKSLPMCVCGKKSKGKVITRKPILPSEQELLVNSRSASAKLRIFEKEFN